MVDGLSATGIYDLYRGLFYRVTLEAGVFLRTLDGTLEISDLPEEGRKFVEEVVEKNIASYAFEPVVKKYTSLQDVLCFKRPLRTSWIELTSKCNQICLHCFVGDQLNKIPHVPKEKVIEYIDELIEHGVRKIIISGGEPTIHPNLEEIIDYIGQSRVRISLLSNASHPHVTRFADCFIRNDVKLEIPLLGWHKTHDQMTGIKGSFKRTVNAIEYFSQRGVKLTLGTTVTSLNIDDISKICSFAKQLGLKLAVDAVHKIGWAAKNHKVLVKTNMLEILKFCQAINQNLHQPTKQVIRIPNRLGKYVHDPTNYKIVDIKNYITEYRECGQKILAILSNGDVSPCILLRQQEHMIGSLKTNTLKEILNRQTLQSKLFDEQMHLAKLPICKNCEARFVCKGSCPASAYAATGSIQNKNPFYDGCYYQKPHSE